MKRIFTIFMLAVWCLLAGKASAKTTDGYVPFIEEGKTWWYRTLVDERIGDLESFDFYFGVTMQGTVEYDGYEWTACHFVNTDGEIVSTRPVALLREEDRKVYVTADHLGEPLKGSWMEKDGVDLAPKPYYYDLIERYGGFSHIFDFWECSWGSNPDFKIEEYRRYPALLYDFSWETGDTFVWPWYTWDGFEGWPATIPLRVEEYGTVQNSDVPLKVWMMAQEDEFASAEEGALPDYRGLIIEGVGSSGLWYYGTGIWSVTRELGSIFFCPCQYPGPALSGYRTREYSVPELLGVELPDGTLLYGDASRPWSGVETVKELASVSDNAIYDLMGRRVDHPVKGTVYIQNGRKTIYNTNK